MDHFLQIGSFKRTRICKFCQIPKTFANISSGSRIGGYEHPENVEIIVETVKFDDLAQQIEFGDRPIVKIDVEGAEPRILTGLHYALPALSFEYLPGAIESVRACVNRLSDLGRYEFNWSPGESYQLASTKWLDHEALESALTTAAAKDQSGDIYAVLK